MLCLSRTCANSRFRAAGEDFLTPMEARFDLRCGTLGKYRRFPANCVPGVVWFCLLSSIAGGGGTFRKLIMGHIDRRVSGSWKSESAADSGTAMNLYRISTELHLALARKKRAVAICILRPPTPKCVYLERALIRIDLLPTGARKFSRNARCLGYRTPSIRPKWTNTAPHGTSSAWTRTRPKRR